MKTKLTLDKSNKVEINYERMTPKIKNIVDIDTLASCMHSPAIIVNQSLIDDINLIRFQRNSQYKLFASIDPECRVFGGSKIHQIRECVNVDGYEIGLTTGKNANELFNEIMSVSNMFTVSGVRYFIRWVVDCKAGQGHIDNCLEALKRARSKNANYDLITIKHNDSDPKVLHGIVKSFRNKLGMEKAVVKIKSPFNEGIIKNVNNVLYEFSAEDLI